MWQFNVFRCHWSIRWGTSLGLNELKLTWRGTCRYDLMINGICMTVALLLLKLHFFTWKQVETAFSWIILKPKWDEILRAIICESVRVLSSYIFYFIRKVNHAWWSTHQSVEFRLWKFHSPSLTMSALRALSRPARSLPSLTRQCRFASHDSHHHHHEHDTTVYPKESQSNCLFPRQNI